MSCQGCICNTCAHNCELYIGYFTPGETDKTCFACDECKYYDRDFTKSSQWRTSCPRYVAAKKYTEKVNAATRSRLRVLRGGKGNK